MAGIKLYFHENGRIKVSRDINFLKKTPIEKFLWIDLLDVNEEIENQLEDFLKIYIQEEEEMEEIEISSRYIETADSLVVNSKFLLDNFEEETVSCILKNDILITVHDQELQSIYNTTRKISSNPRNYPTGFHVLVALFENRVDKDADQIEDMIDNITKFVDTFDREKEDSLMEITKMQEHIMIMQQNIIDKQRAISNLLRSELMPKELNQKLTMIIKDLNSLNEHLKFSFDRLDYLQDLVQGLINIEQNRIMKIFTIVSIIFIPPTLVASIYGQNFINMPFLHNEYGFYISMLIMFVFAAIILIIFKIKKWL